MADKQSLNATFFAFKKRERGGVLLGASLAYGVLAIVLFGGFIAVNWQAIAEYAAWSARFSQQAGASSDPSNPFGGMAPPASVMALGGWYSLFMIFFYLLLASYEAACLRWMIRGETKGLFGLALDGDTLRVYFTYWLWLVLAIGLYIVLSILAVGVIAGVAMGGAQNDPSALASMGIGAVAAGFAVLLLLIFFAVRFSPAAATSIAKRRFAFFEAWTVTKGRFWALLGAFLLLWLMYIVGICLFYGAAFFAVGAQFWQQMATGGPASETDMAAMFASPTIWAPLLVLYLLLIVGGFVFYVSLFGVNARAAQAALEEGKITPVQT